MTSEDEDILVQARAFREGDDAALIRLVALVLRGASPTPFADRLLEFVRPEVESRNDGDTYMESQAVRVCPLCVAPIFDSSRSRADGQSRPSSVKVRVSLAQDWGLLGGLCDACRSMDGRYPEVLSFLRRTSFRLWRFAGAPPEMMRFL